MAIAPAERPVQEGVRVAIDRGGTFCDVWAFIPNHLFNPPIPLELLGNADIIPGDESDNGVQVTFKLLSVDPANYDDAPSEGIRRLLQIVKKQEVSREGLYDTSLIESVRMGTTVATNALLEKKGEPFGLVLTQGFKDMIEIGDQTRPDLFDLSISGKVKMLYNPEDIVQASERVTLEGWSLDQSAPSAEELIERAKSIGDDDVVMGVSGEAVRILKPLDMGRMEEDLQKLYDRGLRALAICLLHSYTYPQHERQIGEIAARIGFTQISLSSNLSPAIKVLPRGNSAVIDAYLSPILRAYVDGFNSHFEGKKAGRWSEFMKSDGGLVSSDKFSGLRAVLSGPAGGFVGSALTAYSRTRARPVVGFDMGGTSTDVSRFSGEFELTFESVVAGVPIACPQLSIETVAAGGGSRLTYKNGMFVVGPESVGAHPGPACYRKGGDLAITDANLVLGRLIPSQFPRIFGPNADESLDVQASRTKFEILTGEINASRPDKSPYTVEEVAAGFIKVANEGMSRPMRQITEQRGFAMSSHDLCCFGGAGGQHACAIAAGLGIETVVVPRFSSILSAYGIACASLSAEAAIPLSAEVVDDFQSSKTYVEASKRIELLKQDVLRQLQDQGANHNEIDYTVTIAAQYDGADTILQIPFTPSLKEDFIQAHLRETSFSSNRKVLMSNIRVRGIGKIFNVTPIDYATSLLEAERLSTSPKIVKPSTFNTAHFDTSSGVQEFQTPVYVLNQVPTNSQINGPAIIVDSTQTIVVEPHARAIVLKEHVIIRLEDKKSGQNEVDGEMSTDPIMLAVFANRFMSIAEQMGHTLQRTSVSVSIKERLDFSCSIHGTDGALVANAPHIPVHLGSMQYAVQAQHNHWLGKLRPGDVLLTNHPQWGGTHLPDLTTVTPVFEPGDDTKVLFYVASRGHHSDIGGTGVTSMNPIAKELWEEGVIIDTFKLVSQGEFNEKGVIELFEKVAERPGCSATRRIDHNITDLQAAISANVRGIKLVHKLFEEFGTKTVLFYMKEIQVVARETIRDFLRNVYDKFDGQALRASDYMDDGTEIKLEVRINREEGTAVFDWNGTGPQVLGNCNMPVALTYAAIIYCLRSMISPEIPMPLNQGVLDPITNIVPAGSYINPTGVVAISGSTLASQRLVDIILQAFKAAACSQGCASSTGFGSGGKDASGKVTPGFSYGESLGGGSGAGPSWNGSNCVHVHCTNTKLTDTEIFEQRCPMLLVESAIRRGSGGTGKFRGGDGMSKLFEARMPLNFSIVSQRRVFHPRGMEGGQDGARGKNTVFRLNSSIGVEEEGYSEIVAGSNGIAKLGTGDRVKIETPGGGGWGAVEA
ncbi:uncharacterized protein I206_106286 [Kwoniella pini CBS 10737]|uniref:5-oxoprolinase (ATP-hydrolysing) n=1 Tax=Kwoniella pini CBS 10737 TaxID=1296096 RepID=A0A1B9I1K4_9TREE|nr:uncharacterized protein I206_05112 [Kwoniella pini CBS 10737]OCF49419.1 hypothetical protein I206_05112 [Kwoniella pini CBS 10737]